MKMKLNAQSNKIQDLSAYKFSLGFSHAHKIILPIS